MPFSEEYHNAVSLDAAREGIVLLKNEGVLPIAPQRIGLFGSGARRTKKGGTGSGDVNERHSVSVEEGLLRSGFTISSSSWLNQYDTVWKNAREAWKSDIEKEVSEGKEFILAYFARPFVNPPENPISEDDTKGIETAVYVLSRISGEGCDRRNEKGDFLLSDSEKFNLEALCRAEKKIILVINTGGMIDLSFLSEMRQIQGIIYLSQGGMQGGQALADILTGAITPSGKLTDTWGRHYENWPSYDSFGANNSNLDTEVYGEGIFVGYRFFDRTPESILYPFGYGLSYTDFRLTGGEIKQDGQTYEASVRVQNIGNQYSGKAVAQLYTAFPQVPGIDREEKRLVAFGKTKNLGAGEAEELKLQFGISELMRYDESKDKWVLDAGEYPLFLGEDAGNIEEAGRIYQKETLEFEPSFSKHSAYISNHVPEQVRAIVNSMTEDELISIVCGRVGGSESQAGAAAQKVVGAAAETVDILRNGEIAVEGIVMADGPAGLRLTQHYQTDEQGNIYQQDIESAIEGGFFTSPVYHKDAIDHYQYCSAFPVGTMLAQTWNPELVEQVGQAVGKEMEHYHISLWLAPGMNIHRNPLCGRNFEYYSEDPYLTGKIAAGMVRGVQSVPGRGVTIKHFACNNQEDNRMGVDCIVDERTLREIYLRGFEIVIKEANPMAVMTSYNKINGTYSANNHKLCTKIAREEWGFEGIFMTDWTTTANGAESYGCILAGNDLIMPGSAADHENIRLALRRGDLKEQDLKACAVRIAAVILRRNTW